MYMQRRGKRRPFTRPFATINIDPSSNITVYTATGAERTTSRRSSQGRLKWSSKSINSIWLAPVCRWSGIHWNLNKFVMWRGIMLDLCIADIWKSGNCGKALVPCAGANFAGFFQSGQKFLNPRGYKAGVTQFFRRQVYMKGAVFSCLMWYYFKTQTELCGAPHKWR